MKTPESPRAYPAPLAESLPSEGREEKLVPRYVHAPALREHGLGPRNLFWGVALLILALVMLVVAIFLAGAQAMVSVATCLLTFTALFVLTRMHVFRQRNGGFLALGLVCLIGAGIPLAEKAYSAAKGIVGSRNSAGSPLVTLHSDEPDAPLLTQSFALPQPQGDGKQVKVLHDSRVVIADKPFLIKAGDRFPFIGAKGNETTFAVRDLHVSLPSDVVEVVDPTALAKGVSSAPASLPGTSTTPTKASAKGNPGEDAELAELTRSAQQEAMRRYPALAIKDSLENAMYVSTYKTLRDSGSDDFFANPEWPIELAELLAKREGWNRGGGPITTGPAPVLDPPADAPPAARPAATPGNLPPVDSLDAGSDLPRATRPAR
ncbi:MAG: hypothetical protein P4L99_20740 [Chthoniobacter sp.]|nr:hypothetical protein [Chthoniobacter sp.]